MIAKGGEMRGEILILVAKSRVSLAAEQQFDCLGMPAVRGKMERSVLGAVCAQDVYARVNRRLNALHIPRFCCSQQLID
jgi:hypothetical protein